MSLSFLTIGIASASAFIVGVRLYNKYFVWKSYDVMLSPALLKNENLLQGKTCIITGGNSGIGFKVAQEVYKLGARVILACRNEEETKRVLKEIRKSFPNSNGHLLYKHLDLMSFDSIKQFTDEINSEESIVNVLINNAAVFGAPLDISQTNDYEPNMQTNHLGSALLTLRLLPKLQNGDKSTMKRVVMVTSTLAKGGRLDEVLFKKLDSNNIQSIRNMSLSNKQIYSSTKLANLLFTQQLISQSDIVHNVEICLASPGFTLTRLHRHTPPLRLLSMAIFAPLLFMIMKGARQGAETIIGCAATDKVESDVLYHNCKANRDFIDQCIQSSHMSPELVYQLTLEQLKDHL